MTDPEILGAFVDAKAAASDDDIAAIREIRERYGLSLATAKEFTHKTSGAASSLSEHQEQLAQGLFGALDDLDANYAQQPQSPPFSDSFTAAFGEEKQSLPIAHRVPSINAGIVVQVRSVAAVPQLFVTRPGIKADLARPA